MEGLQPAKAIMREPDSPARSTLAAAAWGGDNWSEAAAGNGGRAAAAGAVSERAKGLRLKKNAELGQSNADGRIGDAQAQARGFNCGGETEQAAGADAGCLSDFTP